MKIILALLIFSSFAIQSLATDGDTANAEDAAKFKEISIELPLEEIEVLLEQKFNDYIRNTSLTSDGKKKLKNRLRRALNKKISLIAFHAEERGNRLVAPDEEIEEFIRDEIARKIDFLLRSHRFLKLIQLFRDTRDFSSPKLL